MPPVNDLRTLTVEEVADVLGVRPEAVRLWIRDGALEAMRWGRRLRIRPEAVQRFQDSRTVPGPDPHETLRRARRRSRVRA